MNESIAEPIADSGAVVVSADRQRGDEGMVDGLAVVAVVLRTVLLAMHFNRKAIDVDGGVTYTPTTGSFDVSLNCSRKAVSKCFQVTGRLGSSIFEAIDSIKPSRCSASRSKSRGGSCYLAANCKMLGE